MKQTLPVLCVLLGLGSCFSLSQTQESSKPDFQTPLEIYINSLRSHQVDSATAEFAKTCGLKLDETSHRFAFANDDAGTWKVVPSLPNAYDNLDMDLVGTAEVWKSPVGTLIEEWQAALDVGGFGRTLYCFDNAARLIALDSANYQVPENGLPLGMHERWVLQANEKFHADIPFEFIGLDGRRIVQPNLDKDDQKFVASWGKKPPIALTIRDLKLPTALFR